MVIKIHSEASLQLRQKAETEQRDEAKCRARTLQADATPTQFDSYESQAPLGILLLVIYPRGMSAPDHRKTWSRMFAEASTTSTQNGKRSSMVPPHTWRSENNWWELALSNFYLPPTGPGK